MLIRRPRSPSRRGTVPAPGPAAKPVSCKTQQAFAADRPEPKWQEQGTAGSTEAQAGGGQDTGEQSAPHPAPPTPRGRPQGAGRPARRAARSASLGPVGSLRGGFRPHGPHVDSAGCREGHKETLSVRLRAVGRPSRATAPPPGHGENLAWTLRGPDPDPGARGRLARGACDPGRRGRLTLTGARGRGGRDSGRSETRPSSRWTPPTETECGVSQSLGAALSPRGLRAPPCASSTSLPPRNADCPLPSRQLTASASFSLAAPAPPQASGSVRFYRLSLSYMAGWINFRLMTFFL